MEIKLNVDIYADDVKSISVSDLLELYNILTQKEQFEFIKNIQDDIESYKDDLGFLDTKE